MTGSHQTWIEPTGKCFCGCGADTRAGAFFVPSHDRRAESRVIRERYGSIAGFVVAHGFGPDHPQGDGPTVPGE